MSFCKTRSFRVIVVTIPPARSNTRSMVAMPLKTKSPIVSNDVVIVHGDVTPDEVHYRGYFNLADQMIRFGDIYDELGLLT